jgi:hypothetical protein
MPNQWDEICGLFKRYLILYALRCCFYCHTPGTGQLGIGQLGRQGRHVELLESSSGL